MKKIICKVEYDTEASELVAKRTFGAFGDPAGYEESLFKNRSGFYFLHGIGGTESPYAAGEDIRPISEAEAKAWQE